MRDCEEAIETARTNKISSLSIYVDVLGCNDEKYSWLSNLMRSGTRRKVFFDAFGFEDDGSYAGKKRCVKIDLQNLCRRLTNTSSIFALCPIWHLPGVATTTIAGTTCVWHVIDFT